MKQIGVPESGAQTEDVVAFRVLGNRLHNGAINNDQMFGGGLHRPALTRVTRIKQQSGALQAHPIALPAPFAGQLDLVLLAQKPFFHGKETVEKRLNVITLTGSKLSAPLYYV